MESNNKTKIKKDLQNKKLLIERAFNAPINIVWSAWTESDLLDQWWMPKPWKAKTKVLKFEVGGKWHYSSAGPDGTTMWSIGEFISIDKPNSFQYTCSFCDEEGNKDPNFPSNDWKIVFIADGERTKMEVELSYPSEEAMKKMIEMGFETGFTMALGNLEELLGSKI